MDSASPPVEVTVQAPPVTPPLLLLLLPLPLVLPLNPLLLPLPLVLPVPLLPKPPLLLPLPLVLVPPPLLLPEPLVLPKPPLPPLLPPELPPSPEGYPVCELEQAAKAEAAMKHTNVCADIEARMGPLSRGQKDATAPWHLGIRIARWTSAAVSRGSQSERGRR
jgi:hypothetical protein